MNAIRVGTLCIVVQTAYPHLLGKVCECVSTTPAFPQFGAYLFRFPNGEEYHGDAKNVRPITPPDDDVSERTPCYVERA